MCNFYRTFEFSIFFKHTGARDRLFKKNNYENKVSFIFKEISEKKNKVIFIETIRAILRTFAFRVAVYAHLHTQIYVNIHTSLCSVTLYSFTETLLGIRVRKATVNE